MNSKNIQRYLDSVHLGVEWLVLFLRENKGNTNATALEALYKTPMAFAEVGKIADGRDLLHFVVDNYLTDNGHFQGALSQSSQRQCDLYQDLWLAWGAYRLQDFSVAEKCMGFILRFTDKSNGGLRSNIAADSKNVCWDLRSTALGGIVSLSMSHLRVAERAGNFVIRILELQPNFEEGFYLVMDKNGKLVTHFNEDHGRYYIVARDQAQPLYYALGLATAFLAYLFFLRESKNTWLLQKDI
jgi:hypothetical protein